MPVVFIGPNGERRVYDDAPDGVQVRVIALPPMRLAERRAYLDKLSAEHDPDTYTFAVGDGWEHVGTTDPRYGPILDAHQGWAE